MESASLLTKSLVDAGLPVSGISIGAANDRKTWVIDFSATPTGQQKAMAAAIISAFDPDSAAVVDAGVAMELKQSFSPAQVALLKWLARRDGITLEQLKSQLLEIYKEHVEE